MSVSQVSLEQFKRLAGDLRWEPEALMAVSKVEAPKGAFRPDGLPTILFERHVFYRNARRDKRDEWHRLYPTICNPTRTPRGGYGTEAKIRAKYEFALTLDSHAAMMAGSWGAFQELGADYADYGFLNVKEFVAMMKSGIEGQLEIFVSRSIRHRGLTDELRRLDWRGFARNYNGAGYADFGYHNSMATAYTAAKARRINWAAISVAPKFDDQDIMQIVASAELPALSDGEIDGLTASITEAPAAETGSAEPNGLSDEEHAQLAADPGADAGLGNESPASATPVGDPPDAEPSRWFSIEDWKPWAKRWLTRIGAAIPSLGLPAGGGFMFAAMKDPANWHVYAIVGGVIVVLIVIFAIIAGLAVVAIWLWQNRGIPEAKQTQMRIAADPNLKNVGLEFESK